MKGIFIFGGICVWSIDFFIFLYWFLILLITRRKDKEYPSFILKKIKHESKDLAEKRNWLKIAVIITSVITLLWQIKLLLVYFTDKKLFYEFSLPLLLFVTLPGITFLLSQFLITDTFYKLSKKIKRKDK